MTYDPHNLVTSNRSPQRDESDPGRYARSRVIQPPGMLTVTGPVFALVQPVSYVVETQPPDPGLHHLQADGHHAAATVEVVLLVFIVIALGTWSVITRLVRLPLRDA